MGISERKERDKGRIRDEIIQAALSILTTGGYGALSVRKIAQAVEYSTGVIYHYFADKEEIVRAVAEEGYGRIVKNIAETPFDPEKPIEGIKNFYVRYYALMLENRSYAKLALLTDIESLLEKTTVLERGISAKSATFGIMTARLEAAMERGLIRRGDAELTAQIVWTSAYGLLVRLVLEKNTEAEQQDRLMDEFFDLLDRYLKPQLD